MTRKIQLRTLCSLTLCTLALSACASNEEGGHIKREAKYPTGADRDGSTDSIYEKAPSIFGQGGLNIGGNKKDKDSETGNAINSYLWRASLDTVSFMPIISADPFGGLITTDWYTPPEANANERFKLNVVILSQQLRSDGIQVSVFRQAIKNGSWQNIAAPADMAKKLEDSILTRARQLRIRKLDD